MSIGTPEDMAKLMQMILQKCADAAPLHNYDENRWLPLHIATMHPFDPTEDPVDSGVQKGLIGLCADLCLSSQFDAICPQKVIEGCHHCRCNLVHPFLCVETDIDVKTAAEQQKNWSCLETDSDGNRDRDKN